MADRYTKREMVDFLRESVTELEQAISGMTHEQLAYRLPGSPGGPDSSGDESHFDTSQLVTHVASGLTFHWYGMTKALGHERPSFTRPPEGARVTGHRANPMGGGGWQDVPVPELARLLRDTANRFLEYLDGLPAELDPATTARFGSLGELTAHGWLFLAATQPALHLRQLRAMQAQPDYPPGER